MFPYTVGRTKHQSRQGELVLWPAVYWAFSHFSGFSCALFLWLGAATICLGQLALSEPAWYPAVSLSVFTGLLWSSFYSFVFFSQKRLKLLEVVLFTQGPDFSPVCVNGAEDKTA